MNFSDILSFSSQAAFSPNSDFLAVIKGIKLSIYSSSTLSPTASFTLYDQVSHLEWSFDSQLILCAQSKRGIVQVFSLKDPKLDCRLSLGPAGLSNAFFSPDSRHILTICHFQLRLNIWSLTQKEVLAIMSPKYASKGIAFSKCRQFTAILRRNEKTDSVSIFDNNFALVSSFELGTRETEHIQWSNDNFFIVSIDAGGWNVYSPTGEAAFEYRPRGLILFLSLNSPNGCYSALAISSNKIRVIHSIAWTEIIEFQQELDLDGTDFIIYKEIETADKDGVSYSYEIVEGPLKLVGIEGERKPGILKWSYNERFLACKFGKSYSDSSPNVVFIWDVFVLKLKAVLVHRQSVKSIEWCPSSATCAVANGNNRIYLWNEEGASLCELPFERTMAVNKLAWSSDGQRILVKEKSNLVVAHPQFD